MSKVRLAWGEGLATFADESLVLDAWFRAPELGPRPAGRDPLIVPADLERQTGRDDRREVDIRFVSIEVDLDAAPRTVTDAYLRLHLISHRRVLPNTINLDGIYSILPNVVWTTAGPMTIDAYESRLPALKRAAVTAISVDKFPRLTDYVAPSGVRIADASRVRLGAYLASGTTVMHEGFVNFNAGTLGASMIEGRVSQGVVIGDGSDIGGGASIMGTVSGGGTTKISIGERALLGANSGVGISIGDDCVVEAGLYVTAGTKLLLPQGTQTRPGEAVEVKASALSGVAGVLFRRNSMTGTVEAISRTGDFISTTEAELA